MVNLTKGIYVLILRTKSNISITVGALGKISFEKGWWVYVGSAMGTGATNIENRLRRHFRRTKIIHWHIDHLLDQEVVIEAALWAKTEHYLECKIARAIIQSPNFQCGPSGFGSSDCNHNCGTHIFKHLFNYNPESELIEIFRRLELSPYYFKDYKQA